MILDDLAIDELAHRLARGGWTGSASELRDLVHEQNAAASVRTFLMILPESTAARTMVTKTASQFVEAHFDSSSMGIVLYLSSPRSEAELSFRHDYGSRVMTVRRRDREADDYTSEKVSLDA